MNFTATARYRLSWVKLPVSLLIIFLQRTPVLRIVATSAEFVLSSPLGHVLKSSIATAAVLGELNTLAGATELSASRASPADLTVGTPVTIAFSILGTLSEPESWFVGGSVPPGLTFNGGATSGMINAGTLFLSGTPTTAGSYTISLEAEDSVGGSTQAYSYTMNVTGGGPTATAPAITAHPVGLTVTAGSSVTFTAAATGEPGPTFQWRKDGADIGGATGSSLTINNVQAINAGTYTMVATNSAGSVTSNGAVLTVSAATAAPSFAVHPASQSVTIGGSVTFTSAANGNPAPTYQWRKDGADIGGATGSSLTINNVQFSNGGTYAVVASNSAGSATSNGATLTVNAAPVAPAITAQPVSQSVTIGNAVTFNVTATGTATLAYQWRKNGVNLSGQTGTSLSLANIGLGDAGSYSVVVTNGVGSATSNDAVLTVRPKSGNDFNLDGKPDILLENSVSGQRVLWLMGGPNSEFVVLGLDLGFLDAAWHIVGIADFNGDGKPDILLENTISGQRVLWIMGGPHSEYVILGLDLGFLDPVWHIVGMADFNADTKPDILLENGVSGQRVLWLMGGPNSEYVILGLDLGFLDPAWHIVGMADFNADTKPDILLENGVSGQRVLWLMGGPNNQFVLQGLDLGFLDAAWHIVNVADVNQDGGPDILLEDTISGQRVLWLMGGPNNQFVLQGLDLGFLDPVWRIVN